MTPGVVRSISGAQSAVNQRNVTKVWLSPTYDVDTVEIMNEKSVPEWHDPARRACSVGGADETAILGSR
jgi:hypothetical protein